MTTSDRSFGQIMSVLQEHEDFTGLVLGNDGSIDLLCRRLDSLAIPPVPADEVRRAWAREKGRFDPPDWSDEPE